MLYKTLMNSIQTWTTYFSSKICFIIKKNILEDFKNEANEEKELSKGPYTSFDVLQTLSFT